MARFVQETTARFVEENPAGTVAAMAADRPVDLVHLARQTLGNKDLEAEVLDLYQRQSVLLLSRIEGADDERTWREAAHALKGSSQGIGAVRVARCAAAVEAHSKERATAAGIAALMALSHAVTETNSYIRRLRAN
jgi:HPt (histidine-containing phosphotransfer) domain-containing protein